jgi:acetoin utilization deacetylase AcuC-like enzyme
MTTFLYHHDDFENHITPTGHPERVERLEVVLSKLKGPDFADLQWHHAPICEDDHITLCHPESYLAKIIAASPKSGSTSLDADTHMSTGSLVAARRAVGANIAAVDAVMTEQCTNAFAAIRPPGHHAETETPMGFCLFGNVAIAARYALEHHGLSRVAVVDFDVHHGNGTQDLLWNEPRALFISTHQMPLWPGSGKRHETGASDNIINVPIAPETQGPAYRRTFVEHVLRPLDAFAPEIVIISAGFDAHRADPLANLNLTEQDFAWATAELCDIADKHANGRVVSSLEGGYDLDALASSTAAHVKILMERG